MSIVVVENVLVPRIPLFIIQNLYYKSKECLYDCKLLYCSSATTLSVYSEDIQTTTEYQPSSITSIETSMLTITSPFPFSAVSLGERLSYLFLVTSCTY